MKPKLKHTEYYHIRNILMKPTCVPVTIDIKEVTKSHVNNLLQHHFKKTLEIVVDWVRKPGSPPSSTRLHRQKAGVSSLVIV